jgi:N-acetylmuramoyl-L-alanine amidase
MSKKFYVGAGHSNVDSGAMSGKFKEAELVTELRNLVAKHLREAGAIVVTDGEGTTNLSLTESIKLAQQCESGRIELHLNAGAPTAKGVECLSLSDQIRRSQAIAKAIGDILQIPLRGDQGWKSDTEGQHPRLGFCREGGGIVVECFFLTNPTELNNYMTNKIDVAKAIASALLASAG